MSVLLGIDHVAITVADVGKTVAFYDRLFGVETLNDHLRDGVQVIQVILVGGQVRLSVHRLGNGLDLVAGRPTPGSVDICFRWGGRIEEAVTLLKGAGIEIIEGPSPRITAERLPAASVYFRDPDENLIELLAPMSPAGDGSQGQ